MERKRSHKNTRRLTARERARNYLREWMAIPVLDALIKAGAVK